jgi:pSer/pThr/pTyr-binding forkhead associated (FHA) protein
MYLTLSQPSEVKPFKEFAKSLTPVVIGRASKNDPKALDPTSGKMRTEQTKVMSSDHARITWEGEHAFIEDNGSTNGVFIRSGGNESQKLARKFKHKVRALLLRSL